MSKRQLSLALQDAFPDCHDDKRQRLDHEPTDDATLANSSVPEDPPVSFPDPNSFKSATSTRASKKRPRTLQNRHNLHNHFSVFNALLERVDVLLEIIKFLPPRTIINLYSISAPFHYQFNSHYGSFILAATRHWSPDAATIYPWRCYLSLCINDPALRLPSTHPSHSTSTTTTTIQSHYGHREPLGRRPIKTIPSLRWLTMVVYRHLVCKEIIAYLYAARFPVPPLQTHVALKKTWFLLDLQSNAHRAALLRNETYFPHRELYHLLGFCVKLDMYYTDPVAFTGGERVMRKYLLSERTLATLWDYLRGVDGRTRLDLLRLWVKHGYTPRVRGPFPEARRKWEAWEGVDEATVVGVPFRMCGRWGYEFNGLGRKKLLRPDELVMREGVRRGLELERYMWRMMRWGYLDADLKETKSFTKEDIVPSLVLERDMKRKRERERELQKERAMAEREAFVGEERLDVD